MNERSYLDVDPNLPLIRAEHPEWFQAARNHEWSVEEKRELAISFAYGNCVIDNPRITREMVAQAYKDLHPDEA